MGLPRYDGDSYFLAAFLNLAQRRLCAAAILARLFADIFRRLRLGLPPAVDTSKRRKRRIQTRQLPLYAITFLFQLRNY